MAKTTKKEDPVDPLVQDALALMEVVEKEVSEYKTLLDAKKEDWIENMQKMEAVFNWGFSMGKLVHIAEDSSKEQMKIFERLIKVRDDLTVFYKGHRDALDLKQMKARHQDLIVKAADEVFTGILPIFGVLGKKTALDFEAIFIKLDPSAAIAVLYDFGKPEDLQKAAKLLYFFSFHLASLIMFRSGLKEGLARASETQKKMVMYKEGMKIFSDMARLYQNLFVALAVSEKK